MRRADVYAWVEWTVVRHEYAGLSRAGKGLVRPFDFGQAVYPRLARISVAQIYRFRNSTAYRRRNTTYRPRRPTVIPIGERRKPRPQGWPGYLRIDKVHQGDQDGRKGTV